MNKHLTTIFFISILSTFSCAEEKIYSFIGLQSSLTKYEDITAPSYGFKYGQQNNNWRTSLSLNQSKKDENTLQSFLIQVDQGMLSETFQGSSIQPYVGLTFGIAEYKNDQSVSGYLYGLNGGITLILNDSIDLDVGYRMLKTTKFDNIKKVEDLTISLHYFY